MRKNRVWTTLIISVSLAVIFCAGCGKKADPRFPSARCPGTVTDLDVSVVEGGAALKWSVPGGHGEGYAMILKSALKSEDNNCPTCPRIYTIAGYVQLRDLKMDEEKRFIYLDRNIRRGFHYCYRIVICDSSDVCGERSNTAQIEIP